MPKEIWISSRSFRSPMNECMRQRERRDSKKLFASELPPDPAGSHLFLVPVHLFLVAVPVPLESSDSGESVQVVKSSTIEPSERICLLLCCWIFST